MYVLLPVTHECRFFFFSSRSGHTRCYRDWSSDVCSSDLVESGQQPLDGVGCERRVGVERLLTAFDEIGRASWREEGQSLARADVLRRKNTTCMTMRTRDIQNTTAWQIHYCGTE